MEKLKNKWKTHVSEYYFITKTLQSENNFYRTPRGDFFSYYMKKVAAGIL